MVMELSVNGRGLTTNGKITDQQLASIKTTLLTPEVTFCVDDEKSLSASSGKKRFDENSETDSIVSSTVTAYSKKNKCMYTIHSKVDIAV